MYNIHNIHKRSTISSIGGNIVQYPQVERFGPSEAVTERISGISETPATKHVNFILVTNGGGFGGGADMANK